jgi:hypothetical protein
MARTQAVYYRDSGGREPVNDFLDGLDEKTQATLDLQIESDTGASRFVKSCAIAQAASPCDPRVALRDVSGRRSEAAQIRRGEAAGVDEEWPGTWPGLP